MIRNNLHFGDTGTFLLLPVLIVLGIGVVLVFTLPRKSATTAFLFTVFLIPVSQRLVVGGVDFTACRILVTAALIRLCGDYLQGKTILPGSTSSIDKAWIMYCSSVVVSFTVLWWSLPALINRLGFFLDTFGGYIVLRYLIRDRAEVVHVIKVLGVVCMFFACSMAYEARTLSNPLAAFGAGEPWIRNGQARAQATFGHAILAGIFGATTFPLFFGFLRRQKGEAIFAWCSAAAATMMAMAANSSGAYLAYMIGVLGLVSFYVRQHTRLIKWSVIATLAVLHLAMKAPVWALIQRSAVGGGTGYHRYQLVDQTIMRFTDWWIFGVRDYWTWGLDMWDLANTYVSAALTGGLITLFLLLRLLQVIFRSLAKSRSQLAGNVRMEWCVWAFTVAALTHAVSFFDITYYDQTMMLWILFLVITAVITTDPPTLTSPN